MGPPHRQSCPSFAAAASRKPDAQSDRGQTVAPHMAGAAREARDGAAAAGSPNKAGGLTDTVPCLADQHSASRDRQPLCCGRQETSPEWATQPPGQARMQLSRETGRSPTTIGDQGHVRERVETNRVVKVNGSRPGNGCAGGERARYHRAGRATKKGLRLRPLRGLSTNYPPEWTLLESPALAIAPAPNGKTRWRK